MAGLGSVFHSMGAQKQACPCFSWGHLLRRSQCAKKKALASVSEGCSKLKDQQTWLSFIWFSCNQRPFPEVDLVPLG